jgi:hypothetical protein
MTRKLALLTMLALAGCAAQPRAPAPPVAPPPPPEPTVPIPPPPPKGEPESFTGIDAARLQALAGIPAFTRKDGSLEIWRYDTQTCRIFFFLTGAPGKVQHVETLPRGTNSAADPECLSALKSSRPS